MSNLDTKSPGQPLHHRFSPNNSSARIISRGPIPAKTPIQALSGVQCPLLPVLSMTSLFIASPAKASSSPTTAAKSCSSSTSPPSAASPRNTAPSKTLYARFKSSGLVVLGFPANDFGAQEPGSNEEIADFLHHYLRRRLPHVPEDRRHRPRHPSPLPGPHRRPAHRHRRPPAAASAKISNRFLRDVHHGTTTNPEPGILWNFEKFLIGRDGAVIARFSPEVTPDDPTLVAAVESALSVK